MKFVQTLFYAIHVTGNLRKKYTNTSISVLGIKKFLSISEFQKEKSIFLSCIGLYHLNTVVEYHEEFQKYFSFNKQHNDAKVKYHETIESQNFCDEFHILGIIVKKQGVKDIAFPIKGPFEELESTNNREGKAEFIEYISNSSFAHINKECNHFKLQDKLKKYTKEYKVYSYLSVRPHSSLGLEYVAPLNFYLYNGETIQRPFYGAYGKFIAKEMRVDNETYYFVVLPLDNHEERGEEKTNRYMIYLIPKSKSCDLNILWSDFILNRDNNIPRLIAETKPIQIALTIPEISKILWQSDISNFCKPLKNTIQSTTCMFNMRYRQPKLRLSRRISRTFGNVQFKIEGNVPYIAFIYDLDIKEIIFIIKDTGLSH